MIWILGHEQLRGRTVVADEGRTVEVSSQQRNVIRIPDVVQPRGCDPVRLIADAVQPKLVEVGNDYVATLREQACRTERLLDGTDGPVVASLSLVEIAPWILELGRRQRARRIDAEETEGEVVEAS